MYKEVLRAIDGVSIYPIISLALFFIIFTFLIIRVYRYDKLTIQKMADMPLDHDNHDNIDNN